MSVLQKQNSNYTAHQGNADGDLYVMGHGDVLYAVMRDEDIAADEEYVLVDLSDTTNFPHSNTTNLRLYGLDIAVEMDSDGTGTWVLYIGVVTEVDGTDGSVDWLFVFDLETFQQSTDEVTRLVAHPRWPGGLDLTVSGGAMTKCITIEQSAADADFQTDVELDSPYGRAGVTGSAPGAGDLVARWDETANGATVSFTIGVAYTAE